MKSPAEILKEKVLPNTRLIDANGKVNAREYQRFLDVLIANIDRLANEAVRVTGYKTTPGYWIMTGDETHRDDTHTALLLCIEPIERDERVSKEELIECLRSTQHQSPTIAAKLADRIERHGIKTEEK